MGRHNTLIPALFVFYVVGVWLLFEPMLRALHGHWTTANDLDAGYLLLAITLYAFWQLGARTPSAVARLDGQWQRAGLYGTLFVVLLAVAGLASITANKSVTLAVLVAGFVPLCAAIWGRGVISAVLHGCAILMMGTPIWFVLVPQLQSLTARAVNWLLQRGRWPIYIEENLIALPSGLLEIAAGCAGLKFLQTALALTLIEGFVARRSWRAMAVIGVAATALAIVSNWLRVAIITLLALYLGPDHALVLDHNWVGWVLFAGLFGPLFYWLGSVEFFAGSPKDSNQLPAVVATVKTPIVLGLAGIFLALGLGVVWGLTQAAEGDASGRIGSSQLAAAQSLCEPNGNQPGATRKAHPAPAIFVGASLQLDCALGAGRFMSLRGYLVEVQEQEVINPVNQLLPGTGVLDYAVTNARQSALAPGVFTANKTAVAYGFYATGEWTAAPGIFKWRSLARPLVPGPVWALVVTGPLEDASDAGVKEAFLTVAVAMQAGAN